MAPFACAGSDNDIFGPGWDAYYYRFRINGYPTYNAPLNRYDFYDFDENYCGSLVYNPILEEWEYFGLGRGTGTGTEEETPLPSQLPRAGLTPQTTD